MSARTAARRRRQMVNGMKHIAPVGRPRYPKSKTKDQIAKREVRFAELRKRGVIK